MVDEFAHAVTQGPWQIAAEQLDKLPTGRINLQVQLQEDGRTVDRTHTWIDVRNPDPRRNPQSTDPPALTLSDTLPTSYQQGSGEALPVSITGDVPSGSAMVVLAWSDGERRMVDEFAHDVRREPWQISAEQMDKLPAGRVSLQVMLELPGGTRVQDDRWIEIVPPAVQAEPPVVSWSSSAASSYERGSGEAVRFDIAGDLPESHQIQVQAYSHAEGRWVSEFAHQISGAWTVQAGRLDLLPAGRNTLRVTLSAEGFDQSVDEHTLEVSVPQPVALGLDALPTSYQQGSGEALPSLLTGDVPAGAELLVLAWSDDERRMVDEFAHVVGASPWQVTAAQMDKLPAGRVNLQVTMTAPDGTRLKGNRWVEIVPDVVPPAVSWSGEAGSYERGSGAGLAFDITGDLPSGYEVQVEAISASGPVSGFTHTITAQPWQVSSEQLDKLPAGDYTLRLTLMASDFPDSVAERALSVSVPTPPAVGFPDDTPASYQQGSGVDLPVSVTGDVPAGAELVLIAWSDDERRMVDEFAHALDAEPWQIVAAQMDKLPAGRVSLQAMLELPDGKTLRSTRWIEITPALVAPTVSWASASSSYEQGSGASMTFDISGDLPASYEVLVEGYSQAEARWVSEFAHTLTAQPWAVTGEQLDKLPPGTNKVRLTLKTADFADSVAEYDVNVTEAPETAEPLTLEFPGTTPASYERGSGVTLPITVTGDLPSGEVIVLAWSDDERRMVDEFAHVLAGSPWEIASAKLDQLPAGRNSLQLLAYQDDGTEVKRTHWLEVTVPATDPDPDDGDTDDGDTGDGDPTDPDPDDG
ncbi:MAG: hypothetical protein ACLFV3_10745, partial [Phycisphaeraceae bacterium]